MLEVTACCHECALPVSLRRACLGEKCLELESWRKSCFLMRQSKARHPVHMKLRTSRRRLSKLNVSAGSITAFFQHSKASSILLEALNDYLWCVLLQWHCAWKKIGCRSGKLACAFKIWIFMQRWLSAAGCVSRCSLAPCAERHRFSHKLCVMLPVMCQLTGQSEAKALHF